MQPQSHGGDISALKREAFWIYTSNTIDEELDLRPFSSSFWSRHPFWMCVLPFCL